MCLQRISGRATDRIKHIRSNVWKKHRKNISLKDIASVLILEGSENNNFMKRFNKVMKDFKK